MDVRCERCRAQYLVDDDRVPEAGVAVTCAQCGHVFRLKKKALAVTVPLRPDEGLEAQPITGLAAGAQAREWRLRQAGGNVWAFRELTTLQKWIVERKVTRDDEISATGEQWRRLGDIPELSSFFAVVDAADRAQAPNSPRPQAPAEVRSPAKPRPPLAPGTLNEPAWAQGPASQAPAPTSAGRAPPKKAKRGGSWLALLALALAGGVFAAWFYLSRTDEGEAPLLAIPDAGLVAEPAARAPEPVAPPLAQPPRQKPAPVAPAYSPVTAQVAPPASASAEPPSPPKAPSPVQEAAVAPAAAAAGTAVGERSTESPPAAAAPPPAPAAPPAARPVPPATAKKPAAPAAKGAKALIAQARKLRERGRTDAALALYGQAIDLEPTNAAALAGRGACYLETSEYPPAEANFRAALESDPKNADALFGMAETYRYMGRKAEAVTFYEKFIAIHPDGDDAVAAKNAISKLKE
jgi:predicted Zn finger-like uncharacterized protein